MQETDNKNNNCQIRCFLIKKIIPLGLYDYITLIGVLEYAASYIHEKEPYKELLVRAQKHLKPDDNVPPFLRQMIQYCPFAADSQQFIFFFCSEFSRLMKSLTCGTSTAIMHKPYLFSAL